MNGQPDTAHPTAAAPADAAGGPPSCLPPLAEPSRSAFTPPEGACDAHVHIFDPGRHPYAAERSYTPQAAPLAALDALHARYGFARSVIVHAGIHRDHGLLLDALRAEPDRLRGVAVLRGDSTERELDELHEAGVRGVRINLFQRGGRKVYRGGAGFEDAEALAPKLRRRGWHVQAWLDAADLPQWRDRLLALNVTLVVDHMGRITTDRGVDSPGFALLRDMLGRGELWCKLSGADRISVAGPPYADAVPYGRALAEANPRQVVWGTDWPHVNYFADGSMPDDGALLDLVPRTVPDPQAQGWLLTDNPRELYGFR